MDLLNKNLYQYFIFDFSVFSPPPPPPLCFAGLMQDHKVMREKRIHSVFCNCSDVYSSECHL